MQGKILIYHGQSIDSFDGISCIISFRNFPENIILPEGIPIIMLYPTQSYRRSYSNFPIPSQPVKCLIYHYIINPKIWKKDFNISVYFALKYREILLYGQSIDQFPPFPVLAQQVSSLIEGYYHYYSIACSILTALFFTKLGLPAKLPKFIDETYGQDFLDDFFFAPAFVFTVFESTADLLLGEKMKNPLIIAKSFISFLLCRHGKALLRLPYLKLIRYGATPNQLWITL